MTAKQRPVRSLSERRWAQICAEMAAAEPPTADDTGVQSAATGDTLTGDEYRTLRESNRQLRESAPDKY